MEVGGQYAMSWCHAKMASNFFGFLHLRDTCDACDKCVGQCDVRHDAQQLVVVRLHCDALVNLRNRARCTALVHVVLQGGVVP
jgi:hypothetical protein